MLDGGVCFLKVSHEELLRDGWIVGALNVTRHGLGTGRAQAVKELIKRVRLKPVGSATDDS